MPRNGPRQLTRQLLSKPAAVSSASEARCSTPALLTSVVSAPNRSSTSRPRTPTAPPRSRRAGSRYARVAERRHRCLEFVDQQIAGGDLEPVRAQPLDDGRALPAGSAGHQCDPVGLSGTPVHVLPCALRRCSAAPRRSACDSEARVIIRDPSRAMAFPGVPAPAWMPVTRPAADAVGLDARPSRRGPRVGPGVGWPYPREIARSAGPT